MHQAFRSALSWFLKIIYLQIFMMLIAWPILLCWGIPLSLLSPLGNLIFSPFLICFLVISTLIFLCELLTIPNLWLIVILEKLSIFWSIAAQYGTNQALLTLPTPSLAIVIAIPLVVLLFLHYQPAHSTIIKQISCLGVIFFVFVVGIKFMHTSSTLENKLDRSHTLLYAHTTVSLIDSGSRSKNSKNYINYKLLPILAKNYGTQKLDRFILQKLTPASLELATQLCIRKMVSKILLPELATTPTKTTQVYLSQLQIAADNAHIPVRSSRVFFAEECIEGSEREFR